MYKTVEEAKRMWCVQGMCVDSEIYCVGDKCMAWRFGGERRLENGETEPTGYCGLVLGK